MNFNPLDWNGPSFLLLYLVLLLGAVILSFVLADRLRAAGHFGQVTHEDELAVLSGKKDRLAETVIARMLAAGSLVLVDQKLHLGVAAQGSDRLEREILSLEEPLRWSQVRRTADERAWEIESQLIRRGMLVEKEQALTLGLLSGLPFLPLIAFGITKADIGMQRDKPVAFLVILLVLTGIAFLIRWWGTSRLTRAGKEAWMDARLRNRRLKQAPTHAETGTAVAMFGTAVIATSAIGDFHRLRASSVSGDSSGGGCSGGDGGGGGGCGGCGGD